MFVFLFLTDVRLLALADASNRGARHPSMHASAAFQSAISNVGKLYSTSALGQLIQTPVIPLCRRKLEFANYRFGPQAVFGE